MPESEESGSTVEAPVPETERRPSISMWARFKWNAGEVTGGGSWTGEATASKSPSGSPTPVQEETDPDADAASGPRAVAAAGSNASNASHASVRRCHSASSIRISPACCAGSAEPSRNASDPDGCNFVESEGHAPRPPSHGAVLLMVHNARHLTRERMMGTEDPYLKVGP
jgi:hypothetical protein